MKSFGKICLALAVILSSASLFTSCDYLRAALGKPTSADLEAMRVKVAQMREQHIQDSLAQALADSLAAAAADSTAMAAADSLAPVSQPEVAILSKNDLTEKYYVIVGCFSTPEAAVKVYRTISDAGCRSAQVFKLRDERFAVTCFGGETYQEASRAMSEFSESDNCPPDIWIYKTNK